MAQTNIVDAYNTSLTRSTATALSEARNSPAVTSIDDFALFGGGSRDTGNSVSTVDVYNTSLTCSTLASLSNTRGWLASTTVGDYALFGGGSGYTNANIYATVDAYQVTYE